MKTLEETKIAELNVTANVIALCDAVKEAEDSGEYKLAAKKAGKWWQGIGVRPIVDDLPVAEKAAVLARVGALSGWLGSMQQIAGSQEKAKNLIDESAHLFKAIKDNQSWSETRSDLAVCYWREGAFDEARIILDDILRSGFDLDPELEGKILLRSVNVEVSTAQYSRALDLVNRAAFLIEKCENDLLLGKLYFHRAIIFHYQAEEDNKLEYLTSAITGYDSASFHYKKAKHDRYVAMSENNTGNAYRLLEDFEMAHLHLDKALEMYSDLKDKGRAALVYDNKARAFIAEGRLSDAELAALTSVNMLREGGENATLAESLTTLALVLSRGGNKDEAAAAFDEAKETALAVGDRGGAGSAVLTYLEELQKELSEEEFRELYLEADELLYDSPKRSNAIRLQQAAREFFEISAERERRDKWQKFSLPDAVYSYEGQLILKALQESDGRVTRAAKLLGVSHQSLSIILQRRHQELQQHRIRRRPRGSVKKAN